MGEDMMERFRRLEVLVILDWRDGPLEGIVKRGDGTSCWYFKLFAERLESSALDDRLFGLWVISDPASLILCEEFGRTGQGPYLWPVSGGLGSVGARRIVEGFLEARPGSPNLIIRTPDFREVLGVWDVVPN